MKPRTFKRAMGRYPQRVAPFSVEGQKPQTLDPSALFHYWHPDRPGVEPAPKWFADELAKVGPDLRCVRPPASATCSLTRSHCWLVFVKQPRVTHAISPGWMLLIAWHATGGVPGNRQTPLPLDNRLLANLHLQSIQGGREMLGRDFRSPVEYFDTVMAISQREQESRERGHQDDLGRRAKDYSDYRKIKNIGHGSKFALHHDGTLAPGRAESAWLKEREKDLLPAAVIKQRNEEFGRASGAPTVAYDASVGALNRANEQLQRDLRDLRVKRYLRDAIQVRRRERVYT